MNKKDWRHGQLKEGYYIAKGGPQERRFQPIQVRIKMSYNKI
jgi:hypothetical protein